MCTPVKINTHLQIMLEVLLSGVFRKKDCITIEIKESKLSCIPGSVDPQLIGRYAAARLEFFENGLNVLHEYPDY